MSGINHLLTKKHTGGFATIFLACQEQEISNLQKK